MAVDIPKSQTVETADDAGTHAEDVADDATDSGGGSFVGDDLAGVIVAFVSDDDAPALPVLLFRNFYNSGIFTRSHHDILTFGWQLLQMISRGAVGTVLATLDAQNSQLGESEGSPDLSLEVLSFTEGEGDLVFFQSFFSCAGG